MSYPPKFGNGPLHKDWEAAYSVKIEPPRGGSHQFSLSEREWAELNRALRKASGRRELLSRVRNLFYWSQYRKEREEHESH